MTSAVRMLTFTLVALLCLAGSAFAQETTGNIEVTVTDPTSARVPGATVTVTGGSLNRTVAADEQGVARIQQVPPGIYTVSVSGGNFRALTVDNVEVVLGKTTPVEAALQAGGITESVVGSASDVAPIDPTDKKIQTN